MISAFIAEASRMATPDLPDAVHPRRIVNGGRDESVWVMRVECAPAAGDRIPLASRRSETVQLAHTFD